MAFAVVQSKSAIGPNQAPAGGSGLGLTGAPTVGNLVVAFAGFNATYAALTVNTAFWSKGYISFDDGDSNICQLVLYRYVQGGDTAALAPFVTAGSSYWAWTLYEISGVAGTWDSDCFATFGRRNSKNRNFAVLPSITAPVSGALCLTGGNQYNGSANPTISGAWTRDSFANNSAQYGSAAGAHLAAAAGDDLSGTWSFTTSDSPGGYSMIILAAAEPTRPYIAASWAFDSGGVTSDRQLGRIPRQGNIVVCIYWGDSGSSPSPTVNTAGGWVLFALLANGGNAHAVGVYREVQIGDTSLLPKPFTAGGSGFYLEQFFEVGGVTSWALDFVGSSAGRATAGATIATTPVLTDGPGQLGVIAYANYNQTADPVQSGAITYEAVDAWNNGSNYGAWMLVEHLFASTGDSSENTFNRPGDAGGYISMVFGPGAAMSSGAPVTSGDPFSSGDIPAAGARIDQAPRLTVGFIPAIGRLTQGFRLTIGSIAPPARVTQGFRLAVAAGRYPARITQAVRLTVALGVDCVTHWQQLWTITRRDGVKFRYTSLDQDFVQGGIRYKSCGSLMPSAAEESSAVGSVSNIELSGLLTDEGITEADLYGGLFDDAFIEVWLVPFQGSETPRRLAAGWLGALQHGEQGWTGEVIGPGAKLDQQALVVPYAPACRWTFGDSRCTKDLTALQTTGAVTAAANRGLFVTDAPDPGNGSQWENGRVIWVTGRNAGVVCEVKTADFAGTSETTIDLWALCPFIPEVGDTLVLQPGCDLSESTCKQVYGNLINFGGFAEVPGNDALARTPIAKIDT
jgi:uncharacterized phage protein (TIGR02218 family)